MVGMCSLSLGQSNNLVYSFNNGSSTFTGTTSTIYIEMGYFGTKIRSCPTLFPYYSPSNSLCYDVCPSRFYTNTVSSLCLSCTNINCLTCSSDLTTCLSCDSITDRRTLNGTTCSCQTGYYSVAGTSVCSPCSNLCETCSGPVNCLTCVASTNRELVSGYCVCKSGFVDTGVVNCQSCATSMPGCTACSSSTVCTACNSTGQFSLVSGNCSCNAGYYYNATHYTSNLACASCLLGCQVCTSSTTCTTCFSGWTKSGTTCTCPAGRYISGSSCVACPAGCTACSSSTVCSSCDTANGFVLSGSSTCICPSGTTLDPSTSWTSCVACSNTLSNCL